MAVAQPISWLGVQTSLSTGIVSFSKTLNPTLPHNISSIGRVELDSVKALSVCTPDETSNLQVIHLQTPCSSWLTALCRCSGRVLASSSNSTLKMFGCCRREKGNSPQCPLGKGYRWRSHHQSWPRRRSPWTAGPRRIGNSVHSCVCRWPSVPRSAHAWQLCSSGKRRVKSWRSRTKRTGRKTFGRSLPRSGRGLCGDSRWRGRRRATLRAAWGPPQPERRWGGRQWGSGRASIERSSLTPSSSSSYSSNTSVASNTKVMKVCFFSTSRVLFFPLRS